MSTVDITRRIERDVWREPRPTRPLRLIDQQLALLPPVEILRVSDVSSPVLDRIHEFTLGDRCYACGARAIGTRDLRPVGELELACVRHADSIGRAAATGSTP